MLINSNIMKVSTTETDFFNPQIININYKRLDNKYQKCLNGKNVDSRLFWKRKNKKNISFEKFTPLYKDIPGGKFKRMKNRKRTSSLNREQKYFASHRALNYDD